jgi:hypothetical protein
MYLLTPYGIKTKFQLAHKFFIWKTQEYERLKYEIEVYKKEIMETLGDTLSWEESPQDLAYILSKEKQELTERE